MRGWMHDRFTFPLPESHRFPVGKYTLLRDRLAGWELLEAEPASWQALARVQDADLLDRIRDGRLGEREALRAGVGLNLGGGNHHAGRAFARGYCLFNDVALALGELRLDGLAQRAAVIDCDVHQGDGTADLLAPDPDAFTVSLRGARNYPFKRIPSDLARRPALRHGRHGVPRGTGLRAGGRSRRRRLRAEPLGHRRHQPRHRPRSRRPTCRWPPIAQPWPASLSLSTGAW